MKGYESRWPSIQQKMGQVEAHVSRKGARKRNVSVAFGISLKSKRVSRNWGRVQTNLARTLRSILNNTDSHYRVVVAGHEKPRIKELKHRKVHWLSVKFKRPTGPGGFSRDKMRKRRVIGAYLRKVGYSGYFMPLDADDWIHYRFVELIRKLPKADAFIFRSGLMINVVRKEVWWRKDRFFIGCGSSAMHHFKTKDFPRKPNSSRKVAFGMVLKDHKKVSQHVTRRRRRYCMVELPLITWVLAHGDNNSMLKGKKDNSVSAESYGSKGERLDSSLYRYFKIRERLRSSKHRRPYRRSL
ncbi:glycosyltransferase family A protein [Paenibacillus xerothermodurans]|uniref:Glycosyltransferase family 2 protein n=1 Tax=Paenibacillus xerothermodurans TaxID=1977292 RepID=A0A2W1NS75_PAEXE|nr:glycosyltransferase family A protein [Paenibacillus xerothermodurans]PZE21643.1 glycosyltransferase family 2 protein [Paenibacillus xerothermodurans]